MVNIKIMAKKQNDNKKTEDQSGADDAIGAMPSVAKDSMVAEVAEMQSELIKIKQEQIGLENQLKRAVADYQNLEKRVAEGRMELAKWATGELLQKILPILDHFEKAVSGAPEEDKKSGWFKGVEIALGQLRGLLRDEGLEEIVADPGSSPGTGSQFDPSLHEAVDTRDGEDGKILEVVEKGYRLNGKILKPARVIVGKKESND